MFLFSGLSLVTSSSRDLRKHSWTANWQTSLKTLPDCKKYFSSVDVHCCVVKDHALYALNKLVRKML